MRKPAILGSPPAFKEPIFINRPMIPDKNELFAEYEKILSSRWLTNNGRYLQEFEKQLSQFLEVDNCSVFCNGTLALQLAIQGLRLGGEVITTPFTFPATIHALYWNNIKPVFCDVNPQTYNLDTTKIESLITPNTAGILPVHVFGNPCDVYSLEKIAKNYGLKIIYDSAHAFGVKYNGKSIGSFGDASMFSFHATKSFNTLEGGAIASSDIPLINRLSYYKNFGIADEEHVIGPGINGKMNEFQAVFGLLNLKKVNAEIEKRKVLTNIYTNELQKIDGLSFQLFDSAVERNYQYFTIRIEKEKFNLSRDQLHLALKQENIITRKYFYPLCSNYPCYHALPSASKESLPEANNLASSILCLPLYGELKEEEVLKITESIEICHHYAKEIINKIE